jgi:serine protease AprX
MRARTRRSPGGREARPAVPWTRRAVALAVSGLTALAGSALTAPAPARADTSGPLVDVIVRYDETRGAASAERAVVRSGGSVGKRLALIGGFSARVPQGAVAAVQAADGVAAVTRNAPVRLNTGEWEADRDANSLHSITKASGVHDVWRKSDYSNRKVTGTGVGVALIDSGVAPVRGLAGTGKVVNGPDLSFESQTANLRYLDTYGHGTHMAAIIAGRDPDVGSGDEANPDKFVGVAPGAHVVSVKVASADGATDVSQVIAAIDWVVEHRDDPGMNIRVLNLSFGTDSVQDSRMDPLSHAVEVAWRKGIVAVVAVGNDGPSRTRVSMPAANPFVIAVGASDPRSTQWRGDDVVASFSTRGNATRHADILAPGRSGPATPGSGSSAAPAPHRPRPWSPAPPHCCCSSAPR